MDTLSKLDYVSYFTEMTKQFSHNPAPYISRVTQYLNLGLLQPDDALLPTSHKDFVIDRVVGFSPDHERFCIVSMLMKRSPPRSAEEWQPIANLFEAIMQLAIDWLPHERSSLVNLLYNELFYRVYMYYKHADRRVIAHVETLLDPASSQGVTAIKSGEKLLLFHLQTFHLLGGWDAFLAKLSSQESINVVFLKHMMRFVWMIRPFANIAIKELVFSQIANLTLNNQLMGFEVNQLRSVKPDDFVDIFDYLYLILVDDPETDLVLSRHGIAMAFKCLQVEIISKREFAVRWLTGVIEPSKKPRSETPVHKNTHVVSPSMQLRVIEQFKDIITKGEMLIFETLYDHSVLNESIIGSSLELFCWANEQQLTTARHIASIFRSIVNNHLTDDEVVRSLQKLLIDSTETSAWHFPFVWAEWKQFPLQMHTAFSMKLLGALIKSPLTSVEMLPEMSARLWACINDDDIPAAARDAALTQLCDIPSLIHNKESECLRLFSADYKLTHLKILLGIVRTRRMLADKILVVALPHILESFGVLRDQSLLTRAEVKERIRFISNILQYAEDSLTQELLSSLWAHTVPMEKENPKLLDTVIDSLYLMCSSVQNRDQALRMMLELCCEEPALTSRRCLNVFLDLFHEVNYVDGGFKLVKGQPGELDEYIRCALQLKGLNSLGSITVHQNSVEDFEFGLDYLITLYSKVDAGMAAQGQPLREQLCSLCKTLMKRHHEDSDKVVLQILRLMQTFIDKTDRSSSNSKAKAALKVPPLPRSLHQKAQFKKGLMAMQSGMVPEHLVPRSIQVIVLLLLFQKHYWSSFEAWMGADFFDHPERVLDAVDKAPMYKSVVLNDNNEVELAPEPVVLSADPASKIFAASENTFVMLFSTLNNSKSEKVKSVGWSLLKSIDLDPHLIRDLETINPMNKNLDWNVLLGSQKDYMLLYSLRTMYLHFIPTSADSEDSVERKTKWCLKFLRAGGFTHLFSLLSNASQDQQEDLCLTELLRVVYHFMRSGVPMDDIGEKSPVLELSVSTENIVYAQSNVDAIPEIMMDFISKYPQNSQIGTYAAYLLTAAILKLPSLWETFITLPKFVVLFLKALKVDTFADRMVYLTKHAESSEPRVFFRDLLLECRHTADNVQIYKMLSFLIDFDGKLLKELSGERPLTLGPLILIESQLKVAPPEALTSIGQTLAEPLFSEYLYSPPNPDSGTDTSLAVGIPMRRQCFQVLQLLLPYSSDKLKSRVFELLAPQFLSDPVSCNFTPLPRLEGSLDTNESIMGDSSSSHVGLKNLGATCYMNAVVQQLFHVKPFVKGILSAAVPSERKADPPEEKLDEQELMSLLALQSVLRNVLSAPQDEMNRFLDLKDTENGRLVANCTWKEMNGAAWLRSIGWQGEDFLMLPLEVPIETWQARLAELNDRVEQLQVASVKKPLVDPGQVLVQFQRLLSFLVARAHRYYDPTPFVAVFPDATGVPVDPLRQEDANEFFARLQSLLETALAETPQVRVFEELFGFREVTEFTCEQGHVKLVPTEISSNLILEFRPRIEECLRATFCDEWITGSSQCDKCEQSGRRRKLVSLAQTSDHLCVYLRRWNQALQKIVNPFTIESSLDLNEWRSANSSSNQQDDDWRYELTGVLLHNGPTMDAGHYFSVIREDDGRWFRYNDDRVSVFKQELTERNLGGECIMLFYKRKKPRGPTAPVEVAPQFQADIRNRNLQLLQESRKGETGAHALLLSTLSTRAPVESCALAIRVAFQYLARRQAKAQFLKWTQALRQLLSAEQGGADARHWLAYSLLSDRRPWVEALLLTHGDTWVRSEFASVLAIIFDHTETNRHPIRRATHYIDIDPASDSMDQPIDVELLDYVVTLTERSRRSWRTHQQYWKLVAEHVCPRHSAHLCATEYSVYGSDISAERTVYLTMPALLINYFCGPISPHNPASPTRVRIGTRDDTDLIDMFHALSTLLLFLLPPGMVLTPWSADTDRPMEMDEATRKFIKTPYSCMFEIIKLGYNVPAACKFLKHWAFNNRETSTQFLGLALKVLQVAASGHEPNIGRRLLYVYNSTQVLSALLSIKDDQQAFRIEQVFNGTRAVGSRSVFTLLSFIGHRTPELRERTIRGLHPILKLATDDHVIAESIRSKSYSVNPLVQVAHTYLSDAAHNQKNEVVELAMEVATAYSAVTEKSN